MYTVYMIFAAILVVSFITGSIIMLSERKLTKKVSPIDEVKAPTTIIALHKIKDAMEKPLTSTNVVGPGTPPVPNNTLPNSGYTLSEVKPVVSTTPAVVNTPTVNNVTTIPNASVVPNVQNTQINSTVNNDTAQPRIIVSDVQGILDSNNPNIKMDEEII